MLIGVWPQSVHPAEVAAVAAGEMASEPVVTTLATRCTSETAVNENGGNQSGSVIHSDDSGDRDSLAESLTLSDEKSLCDSFTSLDTLDQEIENEVPVPVESVKVRSDPANQAGSLQNLEATVEVESVPVFRRQRWETRSMTNLERSSGPEKLNISVGGWSEAKGADGVAGASDLGSTSSGQSKGSFVRRRDLWEKRTSITSTSTTPAVPQAAPQLQQHRPKHTPDLVMDLPPSLPLSSSPKEGDTLVDPASRQRHESGGSSSSSNSSSPGSPDMTTAAETFAMQNQSTLKKSTIKQIKKDRADAAAASTSVAVTCEHVTVAPVTVVTMAESTRPTSSVKVSVSAYGSASVTTPVSSSIRPVTPKIANRFPHHINLYATPMPVLPVAFAAEAAAAAAASGLSPADPGRPQLKIKPQVLKKPTLPATHLNSPESSRRSGFDQDSHV